MKGGGKGRRSLFFPPLVRHPPRDALKNAVYARDDAGGGGTRGGARTRPRIREGGGALEMKNLRVRL